MKISQTQGFIILFFVTCISIQGGYAIKCWVCRSDSDPKCADPFDNSSVPITDCKQEPELEHLPGVKPTMCRKIRQKVNGVWRYFRSCAYMGEPGIEGDERFCLMRTGTYNIFMESLSTGEAIRCFQCSSNTDPKGEDNCGAYNKFDKNQNIAVECNSEESNMPGSFCMKVVQQSPKGFIWDGRWRQVIRRCASVADTGVTGH
ncbi:crooked [Carabus blaptoides fortunei]